MKDKTNMYPPVAQALRLLRTAQYLTQTAASKKEGAPDFRTLSHWETGRKVPSYTLLSAYLEALGLDLCDLQHALDQFTGRALQERIDVAQRLQEHERRIRQLEAAATLGGVAAFGPLTPST